MYDTSIESYIFRLRLCNIYLLHCKSLVYYSKPNPLVKHLNSMVSKS